MKKLISLIVGIFKKDHVAASTKALSLFDDAIKRLQDVNLSAAQQAAKNLSAISALESRNAVLNNVVSGNKVVLENIGKLLGK